MLKAIYRRLILISRWCTLLKIEAFCVSTLYSRSLLQPAANLPGGGLCHAGDVSTWPSLGWLIRNPTVCLAWITNHHLGGECISQWIAQHWRIFGILTGHLSFANTAMEKHVWTMILESLTSNLLGPLMSVDAIQVRKGWLKQHTDAYNRIQKSSRYFFIHICWHLSTIW